MHKAHPTTTEVTGGKPTTKPADQRTAAQAADLALNYLSEIEKAHEQAHGMALSARYYLNAQKAEPDFFTINFFNVIDSLLQSTQCFREIERHLKPLSERGAQ